MKTKKFFSKLLLVPSLILVLFTCSACDLLAGIGSASPSVGGSGGAIGSEDEFLLSESALSLRAGESALLTTNASGEVFWLSENEDVATVEDGRVTALQIGSTTIVAVSDNIQAECRVTVTGETALALSAERAIVGVGYTTQIKATTAQPARVEWTTADKSIATVTDGAIRGVSLGTTEITATAGTERVTCTVVVEEGHDFLRNGYALVWHDEFNGSSLDGNNWSYQTGTQDHYGNSTGPSNWGNNELQSYREENVKVADGSLAITAQKETEKVNGKSYTSGRITSRGKFSRTYGYVEARMRLPKGDGMWPAFWMLPQPTGTENSHNEYGGWARNGELDIMEAKGRLSNKVDTTLHFGDNSPKNEYKGKTTTLSSDIDEWHTYAVDWRKEYIAWIIDGAEVFRMTYTQWWTAAVSSAENPYAPFDRPFYILFNLAVGGTYDPEGTENLKNSDFTSATMYVDYVRVYAPND